MSHDSPLEVFGTSVLASLFSHVVLHHVGPDSNDEEIVTDPFDQPSRLSCFDLSAADSPSLPCD